MIHSLRDPLITGSRYSGNTAAGSLSNAGSGVTMSWPAPTVSVIGVRRSRSSGASGSRPEPPAESHIIGVGLLRTGMPAASTTANPPPSARTVSPWVCTPNRICRSAGLVAAPRSLTTSTSEKPSGWALTTRSTPGSTSG